MPGLDHTGPLGQGSQTGKKHGKCRRQTTPTDLTQGRRLRHGMRARLNTEEETVFCGGMPGRRGHGRRRLKMEFGHNTRQQQ